MSERAFLETADDLAEQMFRVLAKELECIKDERYAGIVAVAAVDLL